MKFYFENIKKNEKSQQQNDGYHHQDFQMYLQMGCVLHQFSDAESDEDGGYNPDNLDKIVPKTAETS